MSDYIGRKVAVGVGVETVRGTAVAPGFWVRHLSLDFKRKGEAVQNESALGRREKFSDSEIVKQWAEGKLDGKVNHKSFGVILLGAFGTVTSEASGAGFKHTFEVDQSNTPQSLTFAKVDGTVSRRHALGMIKSLEVTIETGEYVKFSCDIVAKQGATGSSETVAYVEEYEFTSSNAYVKFDEVDDVAGAQAATAIAVKSGKVTMDLGVEAYHELGDTEPAEIHANAIEVTGEIVARHTDTTYEDMYHTNTKKAMVLGFENDAVDLGGGLHPKVEFLLPKVSVTDYDTSNDLDAIIEQTMGLTGQLSTTSGYAIKAELTNDVEEYVVSES